MDKPRISIRGVKSTTTAAAKNVFVHINMPHLGISDADSIHEKHFLPAIQCVISEPL
jgi:hypothetical protein